MESLLHLLVRSEHGFGTAPQWSLGEATSAPTVILENSAASCWLLGPPPWVPRGHFHCKDLESELVGKHGNPLWCSEIVKIIVDRQDSRFLRDFPKALKPPNVLSNPHGPHSPAEQAEAMETSPFSPDLPLVLPCNSRRGFHLSASVLFPLPSMMARGAQLHV